MSGWARSQPQCGQNAWPPPAPVGLASAAAAGVGVVAGAAAGGGGGGGGGGGAGVGVAAAAAGPTSSTTIISSGRVATRYGSATVGAMPVTARSARAEIGRAHV